MLLGSPRKAMPITKWVTDLDWRFLLFIFTSFSLLLFFSISPSATTPSAALLRRIPTFFSAAAASSSPKTARIAVCLVGGARRFELTGPSIIENILEEYPNADLFVNSPFDSNSFKFSLLKAAPRVVSIRVFKPSRIQETDSQVRVLTAANSPNGIQGLLQYFNLVEGCLTLIEAHQKQKGFIYDWIIRTRVDGYWSGPLNPTSFVPNEYVVPPGSRYGGLNDRLGIGDYSTTVVALSRLSLIPTLASLNYTGLNSETAFRAQLVARKVSYRDLAQPFCIVTDRTYSYPPSGNGVPVVALSSRGPVSGAKCRPCKPACTGQCVAEVMRSLSKGWSWTPWENGTLELCDASGEWEEGWEEIFDGLVGERLAQSRKRVAQLSVAQCVKDFEEVKGKADHWDTPPLDEICNLGLAPKTN